MADRRIDDLVEEASRSDPREDVLHDGALEIGSTVEGLVDLVDRCATTGDVLLIRATTFPLARAAWELADQDRRVGLVVGRFIGGLPEGADSTTLIGCITALKGLQATDGSILGRGREAIVLLVFRCLKDPDLIVVIASLQLLVQVGDTGELGLLFVSDRLRDLHDELDRLDRGGDREVSALVAEVRAILDRPHR